MKSNFKQKINELVYTGASSIDLLSANDKRELTALYLREVDDAEVWEFITEPHEYETLPRLLIDVLENNYNGKLNLYPPAQTLANTMTVAAVDWCLATIQDAIDDAIIEKESEQGYHGYLFLGRNQYARF